MIDIGTLGGQIIRKWNSEGDLEMLCLEKTEHCNSEKELHQEKQDLELYCNARTSFSLAGNSIAENHS